MLILLLGGKNRYGVNTFLYELAKSAVTLEPVKRRDRNVGLFFKKTTVLYFKTDNSFSFPILEYQS